MISFLYTEDLVYEYNIHEGANLISFPIVSENYEIDYFFNSSNNNLYFNAPINSHLITLIGEGELALNQEGEWIGSLDEIDTKKGYWLISDADISFAFISPETINNFYYLHPGGNLISYPFNTEIPYYEAIPFLTDNLLAVLGENEALYNNNGMLVGSLYTFKPGKGYWFILNDYTPFEFNNSALSSNGNHQQESPITRDNENLDFNQSTLQNAFFIKSIFMNGNNNTENIEIEALCNDNIVGHSNWLGEYSELMVMGNDGFETTQNYCNDSQDVLIRTRDTEQILYNISGEKIWHPNNFEVLTLSNSDFGDLNFNQSINISDIIIMIEHITGINSFDNNHQILLADLNNDNLINVSDVISIISHILEY
jgi:hypothetical protein